MAQTVPIERYVVQGVECYERFDLGILAAAVAPLPRGRWVARLYTGPEDYVREVHPTHAMADNAAFDHARSL